MPGPERKEIQFRTHNTWYTLRDAGDGAWLIKGHETYCPDFTLVTLASEVAIGERVWFAYTNRARTIHTTPVLEIENT